MVYNDGIDSIYIYIYVYMGIVSLRAFCSV